METELDWPSGNSWYFTKELHEDMILIVSLFKLMQSNRCLRKKCMHITCRCKATVNKHTESKTHILLKFSCNLARKKDLLNIMCCICRSRGAVLSPLNSELPPSPPPSPLPRLWEYLQISSAPWRALCWKMICTFFIWYNFNNFLSTLFTPDYPWTLTTSFLRVTKCWLQLLSQIAPHQTDLISPHKQSHTWFFVLTDHPVVCRVDDHRLVSVLPSVGTALVIDEKSGRACRRPGRFSREVCQRQTGRQDRKTA